MTVTDIRSAGVVEDLRQQLRGRLIDHADPGYHIAQRVYNGAVDRRPWAVARVVDGAVALRVQRTR